MGFGGRFNHRNALAWSRFEVLHILFQGSRGVGLFFRGQLDYGISLHVGVPAADIRTVRTVGDSPRSILPEHNMANESIRLVLSLVVALVGMLLFLPIGEQAYSIRLHAINTYGRVIHEFDPW